MVLTDSQLLAFKDARAANMSQLPPALVHGEQPVSLTELSVQLAADYAKKPHVFRVKLPSGGEYLFQARDDAEMRSWLAALESAAAAVSEAGASTAARAQTMPPSALGGVQESHSTEPKKRSFFTLKKK